MVVSPAEREELIRRVTSQVSHRKLDAALVASAVDRVIGVLGTRAEPSTDAERVVVVSAESTPDLASRLRRALPGATLAEVAVASEGRHTVMVARVAGSVVESVRAAAQGLGARVVVRDRS